MPDAILDIKRWGNSLGLRVPAAVARAAHLRADQRVRLVVEGDSVIISPVVDSIPTLAQRLKLFDPDLHGGETMAAAERMGAETW